MLNPDDPANIRKNNGSRWAAGALFIILAATAVFAARVYRSGRDAKEDLPAFEVKRGPLTISVSESGTINPREQMILKSEVEGQTTILYLVPEGTRVKKGDLLVELDASNLEDQKVDQQIRVQNAEASFVRARENLEVIRNQAQSDIDKADLELDFAGQDLKKYIEGEFPQTIKEAEARITLAEEELRRAEEKLKWSKVLFDEKYLSQTELQADELAARKAGLDLDLSRSELDLLKDYTYKRNLASLESNVKQLSMALERTRRKSSADIVQAEADLRAKSSEFDRQKSKLEKIERQIAKARIHAPMDGLVIHSTSARPNWRGNTEPLAEGQSVRERQELIYLPTTSAYISNVKIHESSLDKIRTGLPVRLTVDALPGRSFTGRVATIAPLPDAQNLFFNPDLKVYPTEILVDGNGGDLRTGMSCKAEIIIADYDDAVYIPVQAILIVKGKPTVYVRKGKEWAPRTVELGLDNNRMIRVTGGLEPGELVLLTPPLESAEVEPFRKETDGGIEPAGEVFPAEQTVPDAGIGDRERRPQESGREDRELAPQQRENPQGRMENTTSEERAALRKRFQERNPPGSSTSDAGR